ncbi:hypothetical protein AgCh_026981 [Apium graveolens]
MSGFWSLLVLGVVDDQEVERERDLRERKRAGRDLRETKRVGRDLRETKRIGRDLRETKWVGRDLREMKWGERDLKERERGGRDLREEERGERDLGERERVERDLREIWERELFDIMKFLGSSRTQKFQYKEEERAKMMIKSSNRSALELFLVLAFAVLLVSRSAEGSGNTNAKELSCTSFIDHKEGETCFSIAQEFKLTLAEFIGFNPNLNCNKLFVGEWLCLNAA